jgi:phage internal scaffolding protein
MSDINAIMRKYQSTGVLDSQARGIGVYGDFSNVVDYQDALEKVEEAKRRFAALPSRIRNYVDNDPVKLLELGLDPAREEELKELGIGRAAEEPVEENPPVSSEPSEPSSAPAEEPS